METHKFGIRIPKDVNKSKEIDSANGNHLWWNFILEEMRNIVQMAVRREAPVSAALRRAWEDYRDDALGATGDRPEQRARRK